MVEIHLERTIAAPVEQVFDWLADPDNLAKAPLALKAGWAKDSPGTEAGGVREVIGIGMWFREDITAYQRPHSYSYLIVKSIPAFKHDGGTLTFTPAGNGTHVDWLTNYTHPVHAGGKLMEKVSRPLLTMSFSAILSACATALER